MINGFSRLCRVTAGDCIKEKGGGSVSNLQPAALPPNCREFCSTVNRTEREEMLVRINTRQNRITVQPCTHSVGKPRRSTPSSAAFSRRSTFHNRISSSPNILPCLRPAFNGRTSGHKQITIRVVNFIFFNLIINSVPLTASTCFFFFFLSSLFLLLNSHTCGLCPILRSLSFPSGVSLKTAVPKLCSVPRGSVDT